MWHSFRAWHHLYRSEKETHTELLSSVKRFTNKIVILKTRWAGNHCLLQNCTLIHTISLTHWPAFLRHSIQYLTIFIIRENGMPRLKRSFHYPSRLFILWNSSKKIGCINNLIPKVSWFQTKSVWKIQKNWYKLAFINFVKNRSPQVQPKTDFYPNLKFRKVNLWKAIIFKAE